MNSAPMKTITLDLLRQGHDDEAAWEQGLTEDERAAVGTPHLWSAKDHIVHRTFWHQHLIQRVNAILHHQEVPPRGKSDDEINAEVFAEHQRRPWSEIHAESERVYADLLTLVEQLGEDDLNDTQRFAAISGGWPLYAVFLGNCYEHDQEHIVQYYSDRNDLPRAVAVREQCANRVLQADVPERVKGSFLYNLACFYAQQNQLENATSRLQAAIALDPHLKEQAQRDPELAALRERLA
jgi:tetratricopeptide (TPR) repeat protein